MSEKPEKASRVLSIIIPCFNERATIAEILKRVGAVTLSGWRKEVVVVDDASTDGTTEILHELGRKYPHLKVIFQKQNGGKGSAVKAGLAAATGDYLIIQDADLEYDPAEIPALVRALEEKKADVIYGSRNLFHVKRKGFWIPRMGVWLVTRMVNIFYDLKLTDVWTCYKLFPKRASRYFVAGRFESEIVFTLALARNGFSISETAISHVPRDVKHGKKIRYRDGIKALVVICADKLLYLRKPVHEGVKDSSSFVHLLRAPLSHEPLQRIVDSEGHPAGWATTSGKKYLADEAGRPHLIDKAVFEQNSDEHVSGINWLKSFLKQFPKAYYAVWHLVCPVMMLKNGPRMILRRLAVAGDSSGKTKPVIIDIGSGPERLAKEFINLDVFPFPEVDIVSDATALPFATGSVDGAVSESVFEHVPRADLVAREMVRVLKPGGLFYVSAPFIHPYHASPDDFNRWTVSGLKFLFTDPDRMAGMDVEIVETGVRSGPWSALLLFLAYWLGVLFSLGYKPIAPLLAHIFMIPLGLIKYLDYFFMSLPGADAVATHLYIIGRKK